MADFNTSLQVVLTHEGGAYTNDPNDRGGPTKWGITIPDIPGATAATIQALTQEQAGEIYSKKYWAPLRCGEIQAQGIATVFFDIGVLRGLTGATTAMRSALGLHLPPVAWGHLDDVTLNAINADPFPLQLAFDFLWAVDQTFIARVAADATQAKFLPGWLRRTHHLAAIVSGLKYSW